VTVFYPAPGPLKGKWRLLGDVGDRDAVGHIGSVQFGGTMQWGESFPKRCLDKTLVVSSRSVKTRVGLFNKVKWYKIHTIAWWQRGSVSIESYVRLILVYILEVTVT